MRSRRLPCLQDGANPRRGCDGLLGFGGGAPLEADPRISLHIELQISGNEGLVRESLHAELAPFEEY